MGAGDVSGAAATVGRMATVGRVISRLGRLLVSVTPARASYAMRL